MPCAEVVHLRRARETDAQGMSEVHFAAERAANGDLPPELTSSALSVAEREGLWAHELHAIPADRRPWVAETRIRVVGFVAAGGAHDESDGLGMGEIYALHVLPECWTPGLGRSLLAHAERDLLEHGYGQAVLWVAADDEREAAFLELCGWQRDGMSRISPTDSRAAEVRYRIALDRSRVAELV